MGRVGGTIELSVAGVVYSVKGSFTYNLGRPKREAILSSNLSVAGYKEEPQAPYIEGAITDRGDTDKDVILGMTDGTVSLRLANGITCVLAHAFFAGEGEGSTEEGELAVRWEGETMEEVQA